MASYAWGYVPLYNNDSIRVDPKHSFIVTIVGK